MGGIISHSHRHHNAEGEREAKRQNYQKSLEIHRLIGQGGYSTVFGGVNLSDRQEIAVKRVCLPKLYKECGQNYREVLNILFNELNAYKRIKLHSFIVTLHASFYSQSTCFFILENIRGGDLRNYLNHHCILDEQSAVYLTACIGSALHHLHSYDIIHRDVKPDNILLDAHGRPFLADFGISMVSTPDNPIPLSHSSSGTLAYLAPEVLAPGNIHAYQSDFWSLGVILHEMLVGYRPYWKHCPIEEINYVSQNYGWMWDQLKKDHQISASQIHFDALTPPPDMQTNSDETNCFTASLSNDISCSAECGDLLKGLMNIHIPYRLGSLTRYSNFCYHECFILHEYVPELLRSTNSPLFYQMNSLILQTPPTGGQKLSIQSLSEADSCSLQFPSEYDNDLNEFNYFRDQGSTEKSELCRMGINFDDSFKPIHPSATRDSILRSFSPSSGEYPCSP